MSEDPGEAAWRAAVAKVLKGGDVGQLVWHTRDGIKVEPLSVARADAGRVRRAMPGRWRVAQRVDHPDPVAANLLALEDLDGGADTLTLVAADAASARGFGLSLAREGAIEQTLAGIDLAAIALRLETGAEGSALARLVADLAARRHPATALLDVDFGINPLGALVTAGRLPAPWNAIAADMAAVHQDLRSRGFRSAIFQADGRPWHEAGASEAQELAAVLSAGVLYLRVLEAGGRGLDAARRALSFTLVADTDQLLTIAKFRALRRLWARIEGACGLEPRPIRLHGETAWRSLTRADPHGNILRGASAAFAGAVGGADSLAVLPFTAALGLPDGFARRLARNTQIVLAEEGNLWRVADPAAGAGLFEALTQDLTLHAWTLFQTIEQGGGLIASLMEGRLQADIAACRDTRAADLAAGRETLVGVTLFKPAEPVEARVVMPNPTEGRLGADALGNVALVIMPLVPHRLSEIFEAP